MFKWGYGQWFFANAISKVFSQFTYWERSFWSEWWRIEPASLELTPLAARNSRNAAFSPGSKSLNTERQTLSWSASDFEQTKPHLSWRGFLMFIKIDICPLVDRHDNRTLCFFYKESHKWSNAAINYHKTDRELVAQRIREISPQIHIMLYLKSVNYLLCQLIFQLA